MLDLQTEAWMARYQMGTLSNSRASHSSSKFQGPVWTATLHSSNHPTDKWSSKQTSSCQWWNIWCLNSFLLKLSTSNNPIWTGAISSPLPKETSSLRALPRSTSSTRTSTTCRPSKGLHLTSRSTKISMKSRTQCPNTWTSSTLWAIWRRDKQGPALSHRSPMGLEKKSRRMKGQCMKLSFRTTLKQDSMAIWWDLLTQTSNSSTPTLPRCKGSSAASLLRTISLQSS